MRDEGVSKAQRSDTHDGCDQQATSDQDPNWDLFESQPGWNLCPPNSNTQDDAEPACSIIRLASC